jgi:hypothetical protein
VALDVGAGLTLEFHFSPTIYLDEGVWGSYSATSIPVGLGVGFRERQPSTELRQAQLPRGWAERSQSLPHAEVRTVHGLPQANYRDSMSL